MDTVEWTMLKTLSSHLTTLERIQFFRYSLRTSNVRDGPCRRGRESGRVFHRWCSRTTNVALPLHYRRAQAQPPERYVK
eukprot:9479272-Pyramimonas_sp.AAC.2